MEEKKLYPFRLTRIEDNYPWGSEEFRLADLGYRDTFVHDGWLSGNTLGDLMETYLDRVTGDHVFDTFGVQFPFQIRRIRVRGRMPLRVSPDDETARDRYDHLGKEKLWYVVSAEKGSRLLIGFRRDADASELYTECLQGNPVKLLNTLEPRAGQSFYIPAGTPHCAFGPMTIVEVSESSALDFCLCDWMECGSKGTEAVPFEPEFDPALNIIDALDFIKYEQYPELLLGGNAGGCGPRSIFPPRVAERRGEDRLSAGVPGVETLLQLNRFTVNRVTLNHALSIDNTASETCLAYTSIKGAFEIQTTPEVSPDSERILTATEGETVLIPAETTSFILAPRTADATLLEVMVEKLPADDYPLDAPGNGSEDFVGDGAEDGGKL
jgi:mannose-6-phosphate isomerase